MYMYVKIYKYNIICHKNEIKSCKFNFIDPVVCYSCLINNPINISQ